MLNNWFSLNLVEYNSYLMMLMVEFNDMAMMILLCIMMFILYIFVWFLVNKFNNKNILHNQILEVIWTLIPVFILFFMVIPSLKILYTIEEVVNPCLTLKVMGHQWYWSYEYSDFLNIDFDSFMLTNLDDKNILRLLDVDNRLVLPVKLGVRGLVSSVDVIHSWAMPSLGIKVDAIPGRMNQFIFFMDRLGLYFGQCSEICGLNHSFMPIVLESTSMKGFFNWLKIFN